MKKLTKAQRRELTNLARDDFVERRVAFGRSQTNRPLWALVDKGYAVFSWGPAGSFLKTQGFFITDKGRAALRMSE